MPTSRTDISTTISDMVDRAVELLLVIHTILQALVWHNKHIDLANDHALPSWSNHLVTTRSPITGRCLSDVKLGSVIAVVKMEGPFGLAMGKRWHDILPA